MSKKLGSYHHSKSNFLGLQKSLLEPIFSLERVFEDLKSNFLSDKTPIFFTFSVPKGLIYTWKKEFLESDNCKWSKMAIKVGRFSRPHIPLLHGVIRKLWIDESLDSVQPARCTRERRPEVLPHLSSKYYKTERPQAPPPSCATSWLHTFRQTFYFYLKHI